MEWLEFELVNFEAAIQPLHHGDISFTLWQIFFLLCGFILEKLPFVTVWYQFIFYILYEHCPTESTGHKYLNKQNLLLLFSKIAGVIITGVIKVVGGRDPNELV